MAPKKPASARQAQPAPPAAAPLPSSTPPAPPVVAKPKGQSEIDKRMPSSSGVARDLAGQVQKKKILLVSSYYMCPHPAVYMCPHYYMCVLVLEWRVIWRDRAMLRVSPYHLMCPHSCYMCPHYYIISLPYCMCPHAACVTISPNVC
jgi:hypothetical protein